MRLLPLALLPACLLAACVGQIRDYVGPAAASIRPQLLRYGLNLEQTRCVGDNLGEALNPRQLRLFARAAGGLTDGWFEPGRLTPRDLAYLASRDQDPQVGQAFTRAADSCRLILTPPPVVAAPVEPAGTAPAPGAAAGAAPTGAGSRAATWLNLGAAASGQSIAIDASSIEQQGNSRRAWFRLTDPGSAGPSADMYLLHIDCAGRTINAKARERRGPAAEHVDYPDNPLPVEGGTVMEIAWLSLCT